MGPENADEKKPPSRGGFLVGLDLRSKPGAAPATLTRIAMVWSFTVPCNGWTAVRNKCVFGPAKSLYVYVCWKLSGRNNI